MLTQLFGFVLLFLQDLIYPTYSDIYLTYVFVYMFISLVFYMNGRCIYYFFLSFFSTFLLMFEIYKFLRTTIFSEYIHQLHISHREFGSVFSHIA